MVEATLANVRHVDVDVISALAPPGGLRPWPVRPRSRAVRQPRSRRVTMNHDIERSGSDPNGGRGGRIGLLGRPRGQDKSWTDAPAILLAAAHTLHNACSLQNRDLAPVCGKTYTGQTEKTSREPLEALPQYSHP